MEKTTERKPVVLCPQKVRNILDGKACEIRIPVEDLPKGVLCRDGSLYIQNADGTQEGLVPPYAAGDVLYVKESWKPFAAWSGMICGCKIEYQAGGKVFFDRPYFVPRQKERWRRAANMPECISRAFLNLTGIRAERLWDISEKDAIAEGFYHGWQWHDGAINVGRVVDIPADYDGLMGVPISFLNKHCPEQFDILGITCRGYSPEFRTKVYDRAEYKNANDLNGSACLLVDGKPKMVYERLLIRKR